MKQPNILVVMADQLPPHFTGAYGHPVVQTPNIDLLAARGMRFDAAYCNSPLCAPARAAFLTGQAITRIGAWDNAAEFAASVPTFAHHLRLMGYRTCLSGKMHFIGPDQLHGFERRLTTDIYPADFAWTPNWDRPDEGIWEVRGEREHFVYSKLMCWVALDRALRLADKRSLPAPRRRWMKTRDRIYKTIMENEHVRLNYLAHMGQLAP